MPSVKEHLKSRAAGSAWRLVWKRFSAPDFGAAGAYTHMLISHKGRGAEGRPESGCKRIKHMACGRKWGIIWEREINCGNGRNQRDQTEQWEAVKPRRRDQRERCRVRERNKMILHTIKYSEPSHYDHYKYPSSGAGTQVISAALSRSREKEAELSHISLHSLFQ